MYLLLYTLCGYILCDFIIDANAIFLLLNFFIRVCGFMINICEVKGRFVVMHFDCGYS